jgi:hypothetical protein
MGTAMLFLPASEFGESTKCPATVQTVVWVSGHGFQAIGALFYPVSDLSDLSDGSDRSDGSDGSDRSDKPAHTGEAPDPARAFLTHAHARRLGALSSMRL